MCVSFIVKHLAPFGHAMPLPRLEESSWRNKRETLKHDKNDWGKESRDQDSDPAMPYTCVTPPPGRIKFGSCARLQKLHVRWSSQDSVAVFCHVWWICVVPLLQGWEILVREFLPLRLQFSLSAHLPQRWRKMEYQRLYFISTEKNAFQETLHSCIQIYCTANLREPAALIYTSVIIIVNAAGGLLGAYRWNAEWQQK